MRQGERDADRNYFTSYEEVSEGQTGKTRTRERDGKID